jgi:hypothetical protein
MRNFEIANLRATCSQTCEGNFRNLPRMGMRGFHFFNGRMAQISHAIGNVHAYVHAYVHAIVHAIGPAFKMAAPMRESKMAAPCRISKMAAPTAGKIWRR